MRRLRRRPPPVRQPEAGEPGWAPGFPARRRAHVPHGVAAAGSASTRRRVASGAARARHAGCRGAGRAGDGADLLARLPPGPAVQAGTSARFARRASRRSRQRRASCSGIRRRGRLAVRAGQRCGRGAPGGRRSVASSAPRRAALVRLGKRPCPGRRGGAAEASHAGACGRVRLGRAGPRLKLFHGGEPGQPGQPILRSSRAGRAPVRRGRRRSAVGRA